MRAVRNITQFLELDGLREYNNDFSGFYQISCLPEELLLM
jgi:hypothetical protein